MKKLYILFSLFTICFISCGENKKPASQPTEQELEQMDLLMEQQEADEAYDLKIEKGEKKLEELKSNFLSETRAFYDNNKPMFVDFLNKETLKKVFLAKFNYDGDLIFLVQFNAKGRMHGDFFDLINDGFYDDGVLNCKDCTLVSSNQPMVFTYNYEFKNTYITKGDIINGSLVGNYKVEMNTEEKIYDTQDEAMLIGNQVKTYQTLIPRGTGVYIKTDLYKSEYPFNENGVYDGEIIRTFRNDKLPGKDITIKFVAENGKVRQYIKKDHNGNIIDSISNDFKIWKIDYEYVKKPGFPIFSDPGSFADLPSLFKDVVDDYSPFRDAFDRTKFKQDIKYSITNSPVILIGGETNLKKSKFDYKYGFDPNQVYVPHEAKSPINWFTENEEFQSAYKNYQYKNRSGEIVIGGGDKFKYYNKYLPIDTGGPRSILDENGFWSKRRTDNRLMYEAYSEIGEPNKLSELGKSYLLNDSLKTKVNFHNVGQGFNLFYAAYNVVKGDLILEKIKPTNWYRDLWDAFFHRNVNVRTMGNIKLNEEYVEWDSKSWRKIESDNTYHLYEKPYPHPPGMDHDSKYSISLKDIFYGGKYSILTYENYFKGFDIMSKKLINDREIWVYNNQLKNWEKVNFKDVIELAVTKDNAIGPEYERSLKEKQEAEKKAKEEADRLAWEEYIEVPWSTVAVAPVFEGCDNENPRNQKQCSSNKINSFINDEFNTDLAKDLGLAGRQRIFVAFKFDKSGGVVDIKVRANHPGLEKEAIRVINLLPNKMQSPGFDYRSQIDRERREVFVSYTAFIDFNISKN
tara:strand:- start:707 stop:3103 length:2397 start_codon:yes stop_codon:yes gene_type:complete